MQVRGLRLSLFVLALLGTGVTSAAAIVDVAELPDAAALLAGAAAHPGDRLSHEKVLIAMYGRGADECIVRHLGALDTGQPELAATLREMMAGLYLRERRLHRAQQQLDGIPQARRTDQAKFFAAHIALRQRRLDAAKLILDELGRRLPADALVARDQAQVATLLADHAAAADAAGRLVRIRPDDEYARFMLARARMQQGRTADAERLFGELLARNPRHGAAALNLGLVRLAGGDLPAARQRFVQARALGGGDASPYVAEAATSLLEGVRAAARAAVAGAVKLNAADPLTGLVDVLALGEARDGLAGSGSRAAAAAWFPDLEHWPMPAALATEISSPTAAGRIAAANVLLQLWSPRAALDWLRSTSGPAAEDPLAELTAVRVLLADGQHAAARQRIARLESSPLARELAGPSVLAAEAAARLGDRGGAVDAMRRAKARAPDQARVLILAGDLQNALGQPARAVPEYRAALRLTPADPKLLNQLAATLALVGGRTEHEEALGLAETGLAARPHYMIRALLLDTRADLLFRLGRTGEALAAYGELSTTVGGMSAPEPWLRFGELALAAGDERAARKAFEEALDFGRDFPQRTRAIEALQRLGREETCK